jgi:hypothetical protein
MTSRWRIAAVAFVAALASATSVTAETLHGTPRVGDRTIALPPGNWTKAVEVMTLRGFSQGGPPSNAMNISTAFLRVSGNRVTGVTLVYRSREPSTNFAGFGRLSGCTRSDLFFVAVRADYSHDQDCTIATHMVSTPPQDAQSFAAQYQAAARRAGQLSPTYVGVVTRRSDALHFLTVEYWLAPEAAGFPPANEVWSSNPWHTVNLDAPRRAYMERLKTWSDLAQQQTRLAFLNRPVAPLPEP